MGYKYFTLKITLRLALIAMTMLAMVYTWLQGDYLLTTVNLALLTVIQAVLLVRYIDKFQRDIAFFFRSVKSDDFSMQAQQGAFEELTQAMQEVGDHVGSVKRKLADQNNYFQHVVEQLPVGLLAFNHSGKVQLINAAAADLLQARISDIEECDQLSPGLSQQLKQLAVSQQEVVTLHSNHETLLVSLKASLLKRENEELKLVSLQNIKGELERNEINTWQKLISVLTHEIMNSVAPITSLSGTIKGYFLNKEDGKSKDASQLDNGTIRKTVDGLEIINKRSEGLTSFVEDYRRLSVLPKPQKEAIVLKSLFEDVANLHKRELEEFGILMKIQETKLHVMADKTQLEQVLINLVKNAVYALDTSNDQKRIRLSALKSENQIDILVTDNGKGITDELIDKIFVPFFTTREGGSGIGLSLCRQIMNNHGGSIQVRSELRGDTVFTLRLPQ